jgi:hypothetical protein
MSVLDHLRALGRGDRPSDDGLLGVTRCAWGNGEVIGEEAILAAFCARPFAGEGALAIETAQGAALVGEDGALVADIYHGRIGRLWRTGPGIAAPVEPAVDVAFDPDMHQLRGGLYFRAEDHPELDPSSAERVRSAGEAHLDAVRRTGKLRVRGYVVRAFASPVGAAALIAVHSLGNETQRSADLSYAVVGLGAGDEKARAVSGEEQPREWTPRL